MGRLPRVHGAGAGGRCCGLSALPESGLGSGVWLPPIPRVPDSPSKAYTAPFRAPPWTPPSPQISLDWLAQLLGLPPSLCPAASPAAGAVLYGTASEALLAALLAAKARALAAAGRRPEDALRLVVYATGAPS